MLYIILLILLFSVLLSILDDDMFFLISIGIIIIFWVLLTIIAQLGAFDLQCIPYSKSYSIEKMPDNNYFVLNGDKVSVFINEGNSVKELLVPSSRVEYINGKEASIEIKGMEALPVSEFDKYFFLKGVEGLGGVPKAILDRGTLLNGIVYEEVIITYPMK